MTTHPKTPKARPAEPQHEPQSEQSETEFAEAAPLYPQPGFTSNPADGSVPTPTQAENDAFTLQQMTGTFVRPVKRANPDWWREEPKPEPSARQAPTDAEFSRAIAAQVMAYVDAQLDARIAQAITAERERSAEVVAEALASALDLARTESKQDWKKELSQITIELAKLKSVADELRRALGHGKPIDLPNPLGARPLN
jgi:hypothetical protein